MFSFFKKSSTGTSHHDELNDLLKNPKKSFHSEEINYVSFDKDKELFIPYAAHYNPYSIITKNGQLLQTIQISINPQFSDIEHINESLISAISDNINSPIFSMWTHIVRRKTSLKLKYIPTNPLFHYIDTKWNSVNNWDIQYINELYITILHENLEYTKSAEDYVASFSNDYISNKNNRYLEQANKRLSHAVQLISQSLSKFSVKRLSLTKISDTYYSEILTFFNKIISLNDKKIEFQPVNAVSQLTESKVAIGNTILEVNNSGKKNFASMLSLKSYNFLSYSNLNSFLNLPLEMVITQTIDFIDPKATFEAFNFQRYILAIGSNNNFARYSGITKAVEKDKYTATSYGSSQLSIMIHSENIQTTKDNVHLCTKKLASYGMIAILEDIMLEPTFWMQLPGNFKYIYRKFPLDLDRYAALTSLQGVPRGQKNLSRWRTPISILSTKEGIPYYFNFHVEQHGHTVIIGPPGSGKTITSNFLLSMAHRLDGNLFILDSKLSTEIIVKSFGGKYNIFSSNHTDSLEKDINYAANQMKMNPLLLADSESNRLFLVQWFSYLFISDYTAEEIKDMKENLTKVVDEIFKAPADERQLSNFASNFKKFDTKNSIKKWLAGDKFSYIFDNNQDDLNSPHKIFAFDLTDIINNNELKLPVITYLMHKFESLLTGSPSIIVINNVWDVLNHTFGAKHIENFLLRMHKKNTIVIFSDTLDSTSKPNVSIFNTILKHTSTKLLFKAPKGDMPLYSKLLGINPVNTNIFKSVVISNNEFYIEQNEIPRIVKLNFSDFDDYLAFFGGDKMNIDIMNDIISKNPNTKPSVWVPKFIEAICKHYNIKNKDYSVDVKKQTDNIDFDEYLNSAKKQKTANLKEDIDKIKKESGGDLK